MAGALQVWLVEFDRQVVYIYQSAMKSVKLAAGDVIADIPFLPDFTLPVEEIFTVLPS